MAEWIQAGLGVLVLLGSIGGSYLGVRIALAKMSADVANLKQSVSDLCDDITESERRLNGRIHAGNSESNALKPLLPANGPNNRRIPVKRNGWRTSQCSHEKKRKSFYGSTQNSATLGRLPKNSAFLAGLCIKRARRTRISMRNGRKSHRASPKTSKLRRTAERMMVAASQCFTKGKRLER